MNKFFFIFLAIAVIGAVFLFEAGHLFLTPPMATSTASGPSSPEACAQVITSARNPLTGEIKEFPTPCDVPPTWEVIVNEVPGL